MSIRETYFKNIKNSLTTNFLFVQIIIIQYNKNNILKMFKKIYMAGIFSLNQAS